MQNEVEKLLKQGSDDLDFKLEMENKTVAIISATEIKWNISWVTTTPFLTASSCLEEWPCKTGYTATPYSWLTLI